MIVTIINDNNNHVATDNDNNNPTNSKAQFGVQIVEKLLGFPIYSIYANIFILQFHNINNYQLSIDFRNNVYVWGR